MSSVLKVLLVMVTLYSSTASAGQTQALPAASNGIPSPVLCHANEYASMWWGYGLRGRSPEGHRVLCLQTSRYGLAFDLEGVSFGGLGAWPSPVSESEFMAKPADAVFGLPKVRLEISLEADGEVYRLTSLAKAQDDVRIVEHGRFLQRIEFHQLIFKNAQDQVLPDVKTVLELAAWPDRLALVLHVTPKEAVAKPRARLALALEDGRTPRLALPKATQAEARPLNGSDDHGLAVITSGPTEWAESQPAGGAALVSTESAWWEGDRTLTIPMVILPVRREDAQHLAARIRDQNVPFDGLALQGRGIAPYVHPLQITYDRPRGMYRVQLGEADAEGWTPARDLDRLERVSVRLTNDSDYPRDLRLCFARDQKMEGLPGMVPMLRDGQGFPIGLPVQISKNWHGEYWFHASTMLRLPPRSAFDLEFTMAYAHWGGVPPVSHAQLCLVGWGGHQLWHEVAIGCFGESVTYDPEVGLNRSFIDDVRPLMVRAMTNRYSRNSRWNWTNNVGGGDFLVLCDEHGERQLLSSVRCAYQRYGPNLAEVRYAGRSPDRAIEADITVRHARSEDIVRGLYHLRYDVRNSTRFQRLAFFQMGADRYNDHQFGMLARGTHEGLTQEWPVVTGEPGYNRQGVACPGDQPWVATYAPKPPPRGDRPYDADLHGAWANRGFIVRSWRARLGGADVPNPFISEYRTTNGPPSVAIELAPPPGLDTLQPGDFVEADVEFIVLPVHAGDYYGPNQAMGQALKADGDSWRMVWREAVGNLPAVQALRGAVTRRAPLLVQCDAAGGAEIVMDGGLGFVPVTFRGARDYRHPVLEQQLASGEWVPIDQAVHGNDFWQADFEVDSATWAVAYNVSRDVSGQTTARQAYRFRSGAAGQATAQQ